MNKLSILLLVAMGCFFQNLSAQKISEIDMDLIKKETQDSLSPTYYPTLIDRLLAFDTTLTKHEYQLLYYGNVFYKSYNPYGNAKQESEFMLLFKKQDYEEAIPLGKQVLQENPVNIDIIFKLMVCYHQLDKKVMAKKYAKNYYAFLETIYNSGDGKGIKSAYVVIKVSDEYAILGDLDLKIVQQALRGTTDVLTISKGSRGNANKKKKKRIKELYFNVSLPFAQLSKMFDK